MKDEIALVDRVKAPSIITSNVDRENLSSVELYLISIKASSRNTMKSYLEQVAQILSHKSQGYKAYDWDSLMPKHLEVIKEVLRRQIVVSKGGKELGKGYKPNTINAYLAAIRGVATKSFQYERMDSTVYGLIKLVKRERGGSSSKDKKAIDPKVFRKVIDQSLKSDKKQSTRDAVLVATLFGCGLRRSEAAGLTLDNVDFLDSQMVVLGKGDKKRMVPIPSHVLDLINYWVDEVRGDSPGSLFCSYNNKGEMLLANGISPSGVYYIVKTWASLFAAETGMSVGPHDFRSAYISYLLEQGADISIVADLVGHSDVKTTKIYDRRGDEAMKKAVNLIDF